jgi:glycine cleavage system aminomethyltransferase T/glycine/D-amino acid oxidase-like deaminating enzyme
MSQTPTSASVVIIGAGIVGNSLVHHLARLGWRDMVMVDKGPLPNPGGSTGHASNFIFPVEYSVMMERFTLDSMRQYKELDLYTESGGIEVARSEARMQELGRRRSAATVWGLTAELLTPKDVKNLVPYLDEDVIIGGVHYPEAGVVDSLRAGTIMRENAINAGALSVLASTEVLGIDVADGRIAAVRTTAGTITTDTIAICCGVWSPRIARMAGATIPLMPVVHQMISVGPVPLFADSKGEIEYPIIRDVDTQMYERQHGGDLEVGSYAHRSILIEPDDIPSNEAATLSPTELPFTAEDFDPQMEDALELMPDILGDESVGVRYAINGLISLTPDGMPALGETPEVRGLWSVAASWIKEGPGIARTVAEWMTSGTSEIDVHTADIARFHPYQRTRSYIRQRAYEHFSDTYAIVHPKEQAYSARNVRLAPMHTQEVALGAAFIEGGGWERPLYYESNASLLDEYAGRLLERGDTWESKNWSPIINAEHLAMRDRVGLVDLSAFCAFDVVGPGVVDYLQYLAVSQVDVGIGRVIYTSLLTPNAGIKADLTIMRLGPEHYRIVTGGATGGFDAHWFRKHLPSDGSVQLIDVTSAWTTIGVWGPRARDLVGGLTEDAVDNDGFGFGTCRTIDLAGVPVLASRISYVGELGWELHVPIETGSRAWHLLWEAGTSMGVVPVGIGVYATTGRIEKGYRSYGDELGSEYDLVEAGMARPKVKPADFVGREAYLAQREAEPAALLCTMTLDDGAEPARYMLGGEPVLGADGERLVDALGRPSFVTSAGAGPSVGKHLLMSYLPPDQAVEGTKLAVSYLGESYPVTVVVAGSRPYFDPDNARLRG